ncbi:MAG: hypothetical protein K2J48_06235 [Muribaculaceae bacterium]|nr:hypothetical protein [Muribaculaceae bacterium]
MTLGFSLIFRMCWRQYDNVRPEFLWSLVKRHIPQLKVDVEQVLTALSGNVV